MRKKPIHLKKLFLNKEMIASLQLDRDRQAQIAGGSTTCNVCAPSANPPCTKAVTQCVPTLQQSFCPDLTCGFACTAVNCL